MHDVSDVEQVEPLALIQVAQQDLHVQWLVIDQGLVKKVRGALISLLWRFIDPSHVFVLHHTVLDLFDDWVYPESRALQHTYGVIVVD